MASLFGNDFWKSFWLVWNTGVLLDFDYMDLENVNKRSEIEGNAVIEEDDELTAWAWPVRLFVLAMTSIVGVGFINILIGIMGKAYDESHNLRKQLGLRRKAQIISDWHLLRNGARSCLSCSCCCRSKRVIPGGNRLELSSTLKSDASTERSSAVSNGTNGSCTPSNAPSRLHDSRNNFRYLWYCIEDSREPEKPTHAETGGACDLLEQNHEAIFRVGDHVTILKQSRCNGRRARVVNPSWHRLVKVRMDEDDVKGRIKSYKQSQLEIIQEQISSPLCEEVRRETQELKHRVDILCTRPQAEGWEEMQELQKHVEKVCQLQEQFLKQIGEQDIFKVTRRFSA
jgi:hypothetical protein